jgi:hypothetical protein
MATPSFDTAVHARCPACDAFFCLAPEAGHSGWERATLLEWARLRPSMLVCLGCWTPLAAGHRVVLRRRPAAAPAGVSEGAEGTVRQVLGPGLLLVAFAGDEVALPRDALRYVEGQPARRTERSPVTA